MARAAKKLTDKEIKSQKKAGRYSDGNNLWLQVSPTGTRSWLFQYTVRGTRKARQMGLGPYPSVSLAEARDKAREVELQLRAGEDPIAQRHAARSRALAETSTAVTFRECALDYVSRHKDGWKNPKHQAQWTSTLTTYAFPKIGDLLVADVSEAHVLKILEPIWTTKHETASRLRGRLEKIFDFAKHRKLQAGDNPAAWRGNLSYSLISPSAVHTVKHQPAMPYADLPAFMTDLREKLGTAARALEWMILTTTRTGATIGATKSEIQKIIVENTPAYVWHVPPDRAGVKATSKSPIRRVPLSPRAVDIFNDASANGSEFLFPGFRDGRHLSNMAMLKTLRTMLPHPDKPALSLYVGHGFRSTFTDWAHEQTNASREVIEAALWHTITDKTEEAYRRGDLLNKRIPLMNQWADFCASETRENVVRLRAEG